MLLKRNNRFIAQLFASIFIWLCLMHPVVAQELGKPFIRYYSPTEYNAGSAMFEAVQGPRGLIYYANSWNVRVYNGVSWDYIQMNNQKAARSLAIDSLGTIYVGGDDEVGYFAPNAQGRLVCMSLNPQFDKLIKDFGRVFRAYATIDGIFFWAAKAILHWDGKTANVWHFDKGIKSFFQLNDALFIQLENEGLKRFELGELLDLPKNEALAKLGILGLFPHPNPGKQPIVATLNNGLIHFDEEKQAYLPFSIAINSYLKTNKLISTRVLANGNWALGTLYGGLIITSPAGELMCVVDKSSGLEDVQVNHIYEDKDKILWLSLGNGAAKVEINTPISSWDDETGLVGDVRSIFRFNGRLHVGTSRGLFYLSVNAQGHSEFHPVKELQDYNTIYARKHDISGVEHLIVSTTRGLLHITQNAVDDYIVKELGPIVGGYLINSPNKELPITYIARGSELYKAAYYNNEWQLQGPFEGLENYSLTSIEEDLAGKIWASTSRQGVISFDLERTANYKISNLKQYGLEQGIPDYNFISLEKLQNQVVLTSEKGVFMHNKENDRFEIATRFGPQLADYFTGFYFFEEDMAGDIWYIAYQHGDEIWREWAKLGKDGTYTADSTTLRRIPVMDGTRQGIYADGLQTVWFGGTDGLYRYDRKGEMVFTHNFRSFISKITIGENGKTVFDGAHFKKEGERTVLTHSQQPEQIIQLPYEHNSLVFHFASNNFFEEKLNQYSYKIDGTEEDWSPWESETKEHVRNLAEGKYTFRLRTKNIYGSISEEDTYQFVIIPPWYRSTGAYIGYVIGAVLVVWLAVYLNTKRLRRQRDQLEKTVLERTARIAKQKEEIEAQADNLRNANEEITAKNDALAQQQEELVTKSEEINRQNQMLEHTNKHITDSINYAGRIQQALLGGTEEIERALKDAFVFLQPRDIVSGDFYWFSQCMKDGEEQCSILIAADCTGHGVPGAFMTVMGNALLNEIVNERQVSSPAEILYKLDQQVVSATTRQTTGVGNVNDGMDMGIVKISPCRKYITFAGAKNPLYRVRDGEISVFNGSKFPIGSSQFKQEKVFENEEVDVQPGDVFYIASDGFQDQFGGPNNRKYLRKRFRELLVRIANLPMNEQRKVLENEISEWRAGSPQTDDILVIGFTLDTPE